MFPSFHTRWVGKPQLFLYKLLKNYFYLIQMFEIPSFLIVKAKIQDNGMDCTQRFNCCQKLPIYTKSNKMYNTCQIFPSVVCFLLLPEFIFCLPSHCCPPKASEQSTSKLHVFNGGPLLCLCITITTRCLK